MSGTKPNTEKTDLDHLLEEAEDLTRFALSRGGEMKPVIFLKVADGKVYVIMYGGSMDTPEDKDNFVMIIRTIVLAYSAVAVAITMEMWFRQATGDHTDEFTAREAPDRQEGVIICGEGVGGPQVRKYNTVRHGNGKFFNLVLDQPEGVVFESRFSNLLPNVPVPDEVRLRSKTFLERRGTMMVLHQPDKRNDPQPG